jgi:peptidoglycan L-alanyl-D-glutamate endopeptidase CwlK
MSLVVEQAAFLKDVVLLLKKVEELGFVVTAGELFRTPEQQQIYVKTGRSTTMNSNHLRRCAIDLNIFKDNTLVYDINILRPLGEYWKSLNSKNDWGGFWKSFKDVPHFERKP